jgi:hypothetical protein
MLSACPTGGSWTAFGPFCFFVCLPLCALLSKSDAWNDQHAAPVGNRAVN